MVKVDIGDVPFFNAPIYLENMDSIGKVDEIFGSIKDYVSLQYPDCETKLIVKFISSIIVGVRDTER